MALDTVLYICIPRKTSRTLKRGSSESCQRTSVTFKRTKSACTNQRFSTCKCRRSKTVIDSQEWYIFDLKSLIKTNMLFTPWKNTEQYLQVFFACICHLSKAGPNVVSSTYHN